jgi:hypothetical protein
VKSKRNVVAVGDLDVTETVGPMTSSELHDRLCSVRLHVEHAAQRHAT